jgi:hypothetical protein
MAWSELGRDRRPVMASGADAVSETSLIALVTGSLHEADHNILHRLRSQGAVGLVGRIKDHQGSFAPGA